jgi:hypothetical protein
MDLELKRLMLNGVVFVGGTRPVLLTGGVGNDQYWTDFFLSAFTEGHPVMQEYIRQLDDHLGSLSPEDRETAATSVAEQVARIVRTVELADAQAADAKTRSKP